MEHDWNLDDRCVHCGIRILDAMKHRIFRCQCAPPVNDPHLAWKWANEAIAAHEVGFGTTAAEMPAKPPGKAAQHVPGIGRAIAQTNRPVSLVGALLRYRGV